MCLHLKAQNVGINTDGTPPDPSAMLHVKSNSKGMLIPRVTAIQRNEIALPAKGLLVYQVESPEGFYYNSGTPAAPDWITLGATGPQGVQGNQGPAGATGIINAYYVAGTAPYPNNLNAFISPTITITITAGQRVYVCASRALGGYAAANELCIYPASQLLTPMNNVANLGLGICGLQVPANTRTTLAISGVFENLAQGTYKFGMAGFTTSVNWTNSEWAYVSALVF